MPNDTTKAAPDESPVLKPCPFCGDAMEWRAGDYAAHTSQVDNPCPIALHGFTDRAKWNTHTPPQVKPLVWSTGKSFCSSAHVSFGTYHARWDDGIGAWYGSLELGKHDNPFILEMADVQTEHEAQEACQADYTRRILEALA